MKKENLLDMFKANLVSGEFKEKQKYIAQVREKYTLWDDNLKEE